MSATPPAPPSRPRFVEAAFWIWLAAAFLLVLFGLLLAFTQTTVQPVFRGAGALFVLAGVGLGYLAGRARTGDARFRRAALGLALALVVLLALFSLMTRGLVWLLIMILAMTGAVLIMRPGATAWFDAGGEQ